MIHVLFPTVRPETAITTCQYWLENAVIPHNIKFKFVVSTVAQAKQLAHLGEVTVAVPSKVGLCYPLWCLCKDFTPQDTDIVISASDDFFPPKHWDTILYNVYNSVGHGVFLFDDGYQANTNGIVTLPILTGKAFRHLNNNIYHNAYYHLWADCELYDNAKELGILKDLRTEESPFNHIVFEHRHYVNRKRQPDIHDQNISNIDKYDKDTYQLRKKLSITQRLLNNKHYDTILSILVTTTNNRHHYLTELLKILKPQITPEVELLIDDTVNITIGEKRNRMLNTAKGTYVAFVDDDDLVSKYYVGNILEAIKLQKEQLPDVIGFKLKYDDYRNNKLDNTIIHSIRYDNWFEEEGIYYRCPNHLNPVKTAIAKKVGYENLPEKEDKGYSLALYDHIANEVFIDEFLYIYRYYITNIGIK